MVYGSEYLKRLFFHCPTLVSIVVIMNAFPYFGVSCVIAEDLAHDAADDLAGGRIEVRVEEKNLIMGLFFDILRQLA